MTLMDALDAASSGPFSEDGCAIYISGGTGAVASIIVTRRTMENKFCIAIVEPDTRGLIVPLTPGFLSVDSWEPFSTSRCQDQRLLDLLKKLG